jgi:glutamate synthase (NADPH/NADH) small chain
LGVDLSLENLRRDYDAVYLGIGLGSTNGLNIPGEEKEGVQDAVAFIENLRQAEDKSRIAVGRDVIVIGAGNTAIDAAVQSKRLGAENVTLVYRRGEENMSATEWEVDLARTNGVNVRLWSSPKEIKGNGRAESMVFERTSLVNGGVAGTGDSYELPADMVLKAIGQKLDPVTIEGLDIVGGKVKVSETFETSLSGVFAGGDCVASGEDLTVQAVEDGKQAAHAIDAYLKAK